MSLMREYSLGTLYHIIKRVLAAICLRPKVNTLSLYRPAREITGPLGETGLPRSPVLGPNRFIA